MNSEGKMKEFIFSIMCAGIASGIIGLFFEDDTEIGKYVKLVLSLCFVAEIIPGTAKIFSMQELPEGIFKEYDENVFEDIEKSYDEYIIENARTEMCTALKSRIFQKIGISPDSIGIQFSVEENEDKIIVEVSSVTIKISDACDTGELSSYVRELTGKIPEIITDG